VTKRRGFNSIGGDYISVVGTRCTYDYVASGVFYTRILLASFSVRNLFAISSSGIDVVLGVKGLSSSPSLIATPPIILPCFKAPRVTIAGLGKNGSLSSYVFTALTFLFSTF
jgi:hypothetical protein